MPDCTRDKPKVSNKEVSATRSLTAVSAGVVISNYLKV